MFSVAIYRSQYCFRIRNWISSSSSSSLYLLWSSVVISLVEPRRFQFSFFFFSFFAHKSSSSLHLSSIARLLASPDHSHAFSLAQLAGQMLPLFSELARQSHICLSVQLYCIRHRNTVLISVCRASGHHRIRTDKKRERAKKGKSDTELQLESQSAGAGLDP